MAEQLSIPRPRDDETLDDYVARVFPGCRLRVTFKDGTEYTGDVSFETAMLAASVYRGNNNDSWTAFCADRPWFEFRSADVADMEAV